MSWTKEQIATLAPDAATLDRAQALGKPRKWRYLGSDAPLLWGDARSSGAQYYHTVIDLQTTVYYCSCPSRPQPCKHVLALLLLHLEHPGAFPSASGRPDWLLSWQERRDRPRSPAEEAAADQRRQESRERSLDQRLQLMETGAGELERWLLDLVRRGLALADELSDSFFEEMAARMVDAKLSGIARRIRQWKILRLADDWHERLLEDIAELYLLARSLQRLAVAPTGLRREALTAAGLSIKREEALREPRIADYWLVAGQLTGPVDDNLRFRRTWLLGARHPRPALLLDFAWGDSPFESEWKAGAALQAELAFYPGAYPLRAVVATYEWSNAPFETSNGYAHFQAFGLAYLEALGANPWLLNFPALLNDVVPVRGDDDFLLVDHAQRQLPLAGPSWPLLALGAGRPIRVFGEWDGRRFTPLSALDGERLVVL